MEHAPSPQEVNTKIKQMSPNTTNMKVKMFKKGSTHIYAVGTQHWGTQATTH